MNPIELLELDDEPNTSVGAAGHLTAEQRLDAFERMWRVLTPELRDLLRQAVDKLT